MKFICEKNILQEAISTVQKAVTGKSTMPYFKRYINNSKTIGNEITLNRIRYRFKY